MPTVVLLSVVVLCPIVAAIIIVRGLSGRSMLTQPRCASCGYDVRSVSASTEPACPECGNDLSGPQAVSFGRPVRRPWLIVTGVVVAALPALVFVLGPIVFTLFNPNRGGAGPRQSQPTSVLLGNLKTTADQPWDWQALERRYLQGDLSDREVDLAITRLAEWLETRPQNDQPLHWSGTFLQLVDNGGDLNDEQFARIARAFYTLQPDLKVRSVVERGNRLPFRADRLGHWNLPGMHLIKSLERVQIVGGPRLQPVDRGGEPTHISHSGPFDMDGWIPIDLQPGEYELEFEIVVGIVDETSNDGSAVRGRPGPVEDWPATRYRHSIVLKAPLTVLPEGERAVQVVDPTPQLEQQLREKLGLGTLQCLQSGDQVRLVLHMQPAQPLPLPVSFTIRADLGDRTLRLGSFAAKGNMTISTGTFRSQLNEPLPPELTTADIIFEPDFTTAEQQPELERIWGGTIIFEDYPIRRDDLRTKPAADEQE